MTDPITNVIVEAHHPDYTSDDLRWREQIASLHEELNANTDVTFREQPGEHMKGGVAEVLLALGSAGAFTAAVGVIKAWLERDKFRRVAFRLENSTTTVTFSADTINEAALRQLLNVEKK